LKLIFNSEAQGSVDVSRQVIKVNPDNPQMFANASIP
jgi:hypothetical protein